VQARAVADNARVSADKAERNYRAARLESDSHGRDAVQYGSAEAQARIQAYKDALDTSGTAARAEQAAKELAEKARQAEEKARQADKKVEQAAFDVQLAAQTLPR
jgi:hypothetical protein